ncbi:MAG TPA: VOC family protein [Rhizomicrobium sp.]|nr:VOC family protein [Rhizomicrobium sp.]
MPRPVHFEIHASDPEKLAGFYRKVFDWKVQHLPQMDYWLIDTGPGEGINGGMVKRAGPRAPDGAPVNSFVVTIGVPAIDVYLKRVFEAGATEAVPKMAIPGVGWQAYVKDPDGNIIGLHEADTKAK